MTKLGQLVKVEIDSFHSEGSSSSSQEDMVNRFRHSPNILRNAQRKGKFGSDQIQLSADKGRNHTLDEEDELFRDKLEMIECAPKIGRAGIGSMIDENESEVKLLIENLKPFTTTNFDSLVKTFVITIEDIRRTKEPKFRNLEMKSRF